jgi:hypothetical protein
LHKKVSLLCVALIALLSGCTTPIDKATVYYERSVFIDQLISQAPDIQKPIIQHGRCNVIVGTPGSNTGTLNFCVYAVTQDALLVFSWNASNLQYIPIVQIKWSSISSASLKTFGFTKQIQVSERQRQTGFSAIVDGGSYIDREATIKVFEFAKAKGVKVVDSDGLMKAPQQGTVFVPIMIKR